MQLINLCVIEINKTKLGAKPCCLAHYIQRSNSITPIVRSGCMDRGIGEGMQQNNLQQSRATYKHKNSQGLPNIQRSTLHPDWFNTRRDKGGRSGHTV